MELGELKSKFDELKVLLQNQETRLRYHETRAHNIAMAYLFWQRLFAFGMSHTSSSLSLNCTNWRMVLGFSLSSSFLYLLFFLEAITMLYRAHYLLDMICNKQIEICQQILDAGNPHDGGLSMEAGDSNSSDGLEFSFHVQLLEYRPFRILQREVYIGSTLSALLAVTAFELYMCLENLAWMLRIGGLHCNLIEPRDYLNGSWRRGNTYQEQEQELNSERYSKEMVWLFESVVIPL